MPGCTIGFSPTPYKKCLYVDGHERTDAVEYQKLYLQKLDILDTTHPPLPSHGVMAAPVRSPAATRKLVLICQCAEEGRLVI